jgi:plastocyanin
MRTHVFRVVGVVAVAAALTACARTQEAQARDHAARKSPVDAPIQATATARENAFMKQGDADMAMEHAGTAQMKAAPAEVKIDNFAFGPQALTVAVGATVRWTNRDDIPHSVVSAEGAFKSKALDTDETYSFTFAKAGTYAYFCGLHPKMTGKIVVQ